MAASTQSALKSPSSPFAELLRRSRFASFDPTIRQAYSAPPSHLARGQWGLKRPISARKRPHYISLKAFEEHAQYIDWDNAEPQVRFIKRMEELNVSPKLVEGTPWYLGLGHVATSRDSFLDSEFCPGQVGVGKHQAKNTETKMPVDIDALGKRGKGQYGMHARSSLLASIPEEEGVTIPRLTSMQGARHLQPNIHAMSPRVFRRYLAKLRSLRPEFAEYLEKVQADRRTYGSNLDVDAPKKPKSGEPVISFADVDQFARSNMHMNFLGQHTADEFSAPKPTPAPKKTLLQQPHRFGGLTYASPSLLDSYHQSPVEPGIVVQKDLYPTTIGTISHHQYTSDLPKKNFVAVFAGISAELKQKYAGPEVVPLMDPEPSVTAPKDPNDKSRGRNIRRGIKAKGPSRESMLDTNAMMPYPPRTPAEQTAYPLSPLTSRPMRLTSLHLGSVPTVPSPPSSSNAAVGVGLSAASRPVSQVQLQAQVVVDGAVDQHTRDNTYRPGSMEYMGQMPVGMRPTVTAAIASGLLARKQRMEMDALGGLGLGVAPMYALGGKGSRLSRFPGQVSAAAAAGSVGQKEKTVQNILDSLERMAPAKKRSVGTSWGARAKDFGRTQGTDEGEGEKKD